MFRLNFCSGLKGRRNPTLESRKTRSQEVRRNAVKEIRAKGKRRRGLRCRRAVGKVMLAEGDVDFVWIFFCVAEWILFFVKLMIIFFSLMKAFRCMIRCYSWENDSPVFSSCLLMKCSMLIVIGINPRVWVVWTAKNSLKDTSIDVDPDFLLVMCVCAYDVVIYCHNCRFQSNLGGLPT